MNDLTVDTLNVNLGTRSYPILIAGGLLSRPEVFQEHLSARELLIVSNTTVAPLYLATLGLSDKSSSFDLAGLAEKSAFLAGPMNAAFERPISAAHSKFDGSASNPTTWPSGHAR